MLEEKSIGFIILSVDMNPVAVKHSVESLKLFFPDSKWLTVVPEKIHADVLREMQNYCLNTIKSGDTVTSLIDAGLTAINCEWGFFVMAGTRVRPWCLRLYKRFLKDKTDVLFPVVDRKHLFHESTLNGLLVNKKFFQDVGCFGGNDIENIKKVRLLWAEKAIKKGCKFKALVGAKLI